MTPTKPVSSSPSSTINAKKYPSSHEEDFLLLNMLRLMAKENGMIFNRKQVWLEEVQKAIDSGGKIICILTSNMKLFLLRRKTLSFASINLLEIGGH